MDDLPQDLIMKILLLLEVNRLRRFKKVHKEWCDLISSTLFHSMHLRRMNFTKAIDNIYTVGMCHTLVNRSRDASLVCHMCEVGLAKDKGLPKELSNFFNPTRAEYIMIVGPCCGVFLVYDSHGKGALWNHATQECKILPLGDYDKNEVFSFGFGSEAMPDGRIDFVVVRFSMNASKLYRLSDGSLKYLNSFPKTFNYHIYSTVTVDGVFYWLVIGEGDLGEAFYFMVSFDTRTNIFEKSELPEAVRYPEGSPFLSCYETNGTKMVALTTEFLESMKKGQLWIMTKDGIWVEEEITVEEEIVTNPKEDKWFKVDFYEESLVPLFKSYGRTYKDVLINKM